ncbi:MAG: helix-turn-helix domain-containing protein, partial [Segetibacter sp.]
VKQEMEEDALQQTLEQQQKVFISLSLLQSFSWEKNYDAILTNVENYEDRQIPDKEKCLQWASNLAGMATEQREVAEKFKKQLEYLFITAEQDGYKKLYERTDAASTYFISEVDKLYNSTKKHIDDVKNKQKVKRYVKELQELLVLFERKKQHMQQALQLAKALKNSTQMKDLLQMVEQNKKGPPVQLPEEIQKISVKPEKGESSRISLQMFKEGKSVAEISAERSLSQSTIESHLAGFVTTGEVDILDLVDNATLEKVIALMEAEPELPHSGIKEKAGESVFYSDIRAVRNYLERIKKELA